MPEPYLPADPNLREALRIASDFASAKGLRASALDYHWGAERVQIEWRDGGLRKRLSIDGNRGGKGLSVEVLVRGRYFPVQRALLWLALVALVWWAVTRGAPQAAVTVAVLAIAVWVIPLVARVRPAEAPFYRMPVGVLLAPMDVAGDTLAKLLAGGWCLLHRFGPDDLRREYGAFVTTVNSTVLPLLRRTAEEWRGRLQQSLQGESRSWLLRWPGPHGPALIQVYALPNDHMGVAPYAGDRSPRRLALHRVEWGDMPGLRLALAQARQAAEFGAIGHAR